MSNKDKNLKQLLIQNLNDINNASSPQTIWNIVQAMQSETNDVFKLQDWDKVREYCWNLASYSGQQKDKLGYIVAERNMLFEYNVSRAISIYKEQKVKGDESKITFKEKSFIVPLKDYKPNHKDLEKNPDKMVKIPLSEIVEFSDYSISGVRATKGTTSKPIFSEALYEAIIDFKLSILKGHNLITHTKETNIYSFNYEAFVDKFDDDVIKDLKELQDFINQLLEVNETATNELDADGNVEVPQEIKDQHIVNFKPQVKFLKAS